MPKQSHRFPASTLGAYLPGVGIALTRANVREYQQELALRGHAPAIPAQILVAFTKPRQARKDWEPDPRHVARMGQLMRRKQAAVPA